MSAVFILFWMPPVQNTHWLNFIWGVFFATAFYWCITIVLVPYVALLPEIARTTVGRVKLGIYNAVGMIFSLILGILSGMLIEQIGIKLTAITYGIVSFICFQITGWVVKERYKPDGEMIVSSLSEMFSQLASTLKNQPFLIFLAAETIFTLGFFVIQIMLPDYNSVILGKGEGFVTILFIPFLLVCFPLLFVVEPSVKKWNKKSAYSAGLFGFAILFPFLGGGFVLIGYVINRKRIESEEEARPKRYEDPEWLKQQYITLNRSIQDMASEEGVSMMEIKRHVERLESNVS